MVASGAWRRIVPARRLRGRFRLPGDKSLSHRLAILAALAEGTSRFGNFSTAGDCASTLASLEALGARIAVDAPGSAVSIAGGGAGALHAAAHPLDAGNSGSTLRMLAGVLAARPFTSVLDGDSSLRARPVERVAAPLRAMGARIATTAGRPPVTIDGGPLVGVAHTLTIPSAQVKTAILLAGLQAEGQTVVTEPSPSRDHTERLLPCFGVPVWRTELSVGVKGGARPTPFEMDVPGDPSSAAFLVVAALIVPDARVRLEGVLLNPSRIAFLDVLRRMGGSIRVGIERSEPEPVGWIEAETSPLRGIDIAASAVAALIDEIPVLAVAGAAAHGTFRVVGAEELRVKESDRIAAIAEGLRGMGALVEEHADGLVIEGGRPLRGAAVRSWGDHRIAMALAVAALAAAEGVTLIEGAGCASVSFPEFFAVLDRAVVAG
jgi:3-phosphoshikimate 1-carboxyvinyltransferase